MPVVLGMVSQKGGVGKSTLARLVASEYGRAGWAVKICDLDLGQGTSYCWQGRRLQNEVTPEISVERYRTVEQVFRMGHSLFDLLIIDGPPNSTAETLRIAEACDVTVLPTGLSLDDLQPTVLLAHELVKKGIPSRQLVFALCRVGDSDAEIEEARNYIEEAGYRVLSGELPEKVAYRRAGDIGRSVSETWYKSLNERAEQLAQGIVDLLKQQEDNGKDITTQKEGVTPVHVRDNRQSG